MDDRAIPSFDILPEPGWHAAANADTVMHYASKIVGYLALGGAIVAGVMLMLL
ncbi:hypothetical protein [Sphingobium amiense]|uniref:hypothetical protein n=1 Tax=Sphingobium amiense TaxID=135719 RepID=UPI000AB2087D|nr:hypothetical protein [Sphingobium amiense]